MTWEILAALIGMGTFGIAIGKIVSNNTRVITELKCAIDALAGRLERLENAFTV